MGGGSILGGLMLGAIGVFVIDRNFTKASIFAAAGGGADLLRLHARREDRLRRIAGHGAQLPRRRDHPLRLRPLGRALTAPVTVPELHGDPEPLPAAE